MQYGCVENNREKCGCVEIIADKRGRLSPYEVEKCFKYLNGLPFSLCVSDEDTKWRIPNHNSSVYDVMVDSFE